MPRISNNMVYNRDVVLSLALRLYEAIEQNNLDDLQDLILRKGANPNVILPGKGVSPFHLAVGIETAAFSEKATRLFLLYGGNPNVRSCEGLTPVHVASIRGCSESLRLLLMAGGDPEALDDEDYSPLYYAHLEGHLGCAELLQTYKSIKRKFSVKNLLNRNNETKIIPRNYNTFKNRILKINDKSGSTDDSKEYIMDLNISNCFNQYITEEEDANHTEKVIVNETYRLRDLKNESLLLLTDFSKFIPIASSTLNSQSNDERISNQLSSTSLDSGSMELKNYRVGNIKNKTFLKTEEEYDSIFDKNDNRNHLKSDKVCYNETYCEFDQNKESDMNGSGKINNETFSKISTPLNTYKASCNLNNTWIKESLIEDPEIQSNNGVSKETYDLSLIDTCNALTEECSDFPEECEKLKTNGCVNQHEIGETIQNNCDAAHIDSICIETVSSTISKEKNIAIDSIQKSNDLPKFSPVCNSNGISGKSDASINESWLASNSCFSETNDVKKCLGKKATDDENGDIEEINDSKFLEIYGKECDVEKYEDIDFNGDNSFSDCSKVNDETFTKNGCSPFRSLPLYLTYDMSDWSPDSMLTYNMCDYSIMSSDRSSPIENESNTSGKPSRIYKRFSKSGLSLISENFRERTKYVTHRKKGLVNINLEESTISCSDCSESEDYFTVPEELYQYTDEEEGVVFVEKKLLPVVHPNISTISSNVPDNELDSENLGRADSCASSLSTCDTEVLRKEVYDAVSSGCCCPLGPITATTKRVYLRKIQRFKESMKDNYNPQPSKKTILGIPKFSRELEKMLAKPQSLDQSKYIDIEQRMMAQFDGSHKKNRWREGSQKTSFNYLLLDPRVTCNLPLRWAMDNTMAKGPCSEENCQYWRDFLCAIFYIGKGKRSRPYAHLYQAFNSWRTGGRDNKSSKKIKHILDIWKENLGVVCLHVFQNAIPAEAFTREAAMIDAIGLNNLKNEQRGEYYGVVSSMGFSQKREFGSFLLHRALFIFLNDGERQIRPADIN